MLRTYLSHTFLSCLLLLVLSSCEKVVDINLKDAEPKLVIEGVVTNRVDSQIVKIKRSVLFGEANEFPDVSGATVTITDLTTNRVFNLLERRAGIYTAKNFVGRSGRTYQLKVRVYDEEYVAVSTMPDQVNIDSLGITSSVIFGKDQRTVQVLFSDPISVKNYYRFTLKINGKLSKNIFSFDDNFTNGKKVIRELFDFDLNANRGDKVELEMQCIDPVVFRYWQGLDQNEGRGGASTTPANPVSNISNGALGYFSAHTRQNEAITIP